MSFIINVFDNKEPSVPFDDNNFIYNYKILNN